MSYQRSNIGVIFLVSFLFFMILLLTLDQANANTPPNELFSTTTVTENDLPSVLTGIVYDDGVPVEGANVNLLRDETVVYTTITTLGAGTVPSFTVTLNDPPINAIVDELLTLEVEYLGDYNRVSFIVAPGDQTVAGALNSTCGETEITTGLLSSDTTWTAACGPYLIRTNVLVNAGVTLTIEEGTTVMFDTEKAMMVNGRLLTHGAPNALVTFTTGQATPWGYLSFYGSSTGSVLEHTLVEYAGGVNVDPNAAVRVDGVDAQFNGLIVRESEAAEGDEAAAGIAVFNDGTAVMDNLLVFNNQGRGIYVDSDTQTLSITNSTIRDNEGGGIHVLNDTSGTISHNIIDDNNGISGAGIYLYGVDSVSIAENKITNNDASYRGGGICVLIVGTDVTIRDNYIAFNDASRGGGIYSASSAVSDISRNFILYNRTTYANGRAGGGLYSSSGAAIENNIFAGNMAADGGQGGGAVFYPLGDNATVQRNTFAYNFSETNGGAAFYIRESTPDYTLEANTIFSNTATSSPISDYGAVQISNYPATLHYNNVFDNRLYDLMNSAPFAEGPVDAQYNWWATTDSADIQDQIYDWYDDAAVGIVDYANWLTEPWTVAPVSPPTGVMAVVDQSSILLDWETNPEADIAGYKIYLDTSDLLFDPAVNGELIGVDVGLDTSFTLACLPPDTYYLSVTAYDTDANGVDDWTDGNESWFSRELEVTTSATNVCEPPTVPTALDATPVSSSQINLSWNDNATDETSYRVERSPDGSTNWTEIANIAANSTTYSDTGLTCETTYHYRVRAYRAGDTLFSGYSNLAQATTSACPTVLPAPTGLEATAVSADQINLSWTDNAVDETSYHVEQLPEGNATWIEIACLSANTTTYQDTGLTSGTTYQYRICAHRAGDNLYSAYSNIAQAKTDWLLYLPIILRP